MEKMALNESASVAAMTSVFLRCFDEKCGARYPVTEVRPECACGNLLDVRYELSDFDAEAVKQVWKIRATTQVEVRIQKSDPQRFAV